MEKAIAQLRYLRVAPRKVRSVADLLRLSSVSDAEAELTLLPRKASVHLLKLLRSAVANAKVLKMNQANLYIQEIRVDEGPKLKRMMPRMGGRGAEIQKKTSHITIVLGERDKKSKHVFLMPVKSKTAKTEKPKKVSPKPVVRKEKDEKKEPKKVEKKKESSRKLFQRKSV